jgi:predicted nucleic acid-binding protein
VRFVDTNVLLYAASTSQDEQQKADRARSLLTARDLVVSTQVLAEFYVQATRATRRDAMTHEQARRLVESFTRWPVQAVTVEVVRAALATRQRFGLSYWDAAIVESARAAGCATLLTEDLQPGQDLGGVRVVDPFR